MPTLNWIGKEAVIKHHKDVPFRLLEHDADLSHGQDDSGNIIVQGDNLQALKALLPRYAGQVKCIYIDPPYNTGNEGWVYNDNVNSPEIRKWLGEAVGKEGETLDRHDRWLCMMYPRLVLLKQFMTDDGIIFVSIDDNEIHYLRSLMDEIFGIKKRVATLVWRTDGNFDNQAKIKNCHEYILIYASNPEKLPHPKVIDPSVTKDSKLNRDFIQNTIIKNGPKNPISKVILPAGFPASVQEAHISKKHDSWPYIYNDVTIRNGKLTHDVTVESGWASKNLLLEFIASGFKPVLDTKNQRTTFFITATGAIESKKERENASHVITVISGVGSTQSQSQKLSDMGFKFPFPKPVELVKYLISMIDDKDFLVLDSFAGSGTTAHAVLQQNKEDNGNRKFILIEMNEHIAKNLTTERVKKICNGYKNNKGVEFSGLGNGFKFFNLSAEPLFQPEGPIRKNVTFNELSEFVWFMETGSGLTVSPLAKKQPSTPFLGVHQEKAVFLLYNGILKDRSDIGGNVLNHRSLRFLDEITPPHFSGTRIVYGARSRFDKKKLNQLGIIFHQLPYELAVKTWL